MTTRKKVTDEAKPPAKRSRKKATPPDLFGAAAPAEAAISDPGMPSEASDNEAGQRPGPMQDRPEPTPPSTQHPVSPHTAAEPDNVPVGNPGPSHAAASNRLQIDAATQTWLLATNHLNLLYMLAAGMVMGPAGFAGKHYRDPSSELSGLIPVFSNGVPEAALQQAVSEQKHLRPCIAEIDLAALAGPVRQVSRNGEVSSGTLPSSVGSEIGALLVSAPLPMTLVKRLVFRSPTDLKEFDASARNFANIDLAGLSIEVSEQFFSSARSMVWPLPGQSQDIIRDMVDQPPARGEAIGGVLATLYQLANRSDLCGSVYRVACGADSPGDYDVTQRDPVLAGLVPWIESKGPRPEGSVQARLFWGAVQALVDSRLDRSTERPVDAVIDYLDGQLAGLRETSFHTRLERLLSDMRSVFGLGGGTIGQLFERHKGTLSRPLLMFCLKERCTELLEFTHPDLRDEELVLAAILFGVRDGWFGMPVELRGSKELSRFIEQRMFEVEVSQRGAKLTLNQTSSRPMSLRELVKMDGMAWGEVRNAALVKVVSRVGWQDCIVSRMRLPPGQYCLNVSAEGLEIVVRGGIRSPVVEIDREGLLKKISQWPPMPPGVEGEVRAALDPRN